MSSARIRIPGGYFPRLRVLILLAASFGCSLPDVHVRPGPQKQSAQRSNDAGQRSQLDGGASGPMDADGGTSSAPVERPRASDAGTDAGSEQSTEDAGDSRSSIADAGSSAAANGNSAGAAGCFGSSCSDCTNDNDCEQRGILGGRCRDARCVAPPAECQSDQDCEKLGPEYAGGRCAGTLCFPNPRWRCEPSTAMAAEPREITLPVIDALALQPIANAPIVACRKSDLMCMEQVAVATSGRNGEAKLTVPADFSGYLQQTELDDYVPAMYFVPARLPDDGVLSNFPLVPSSSFRGLALAIGTTAEPARGHAMLIALDCNGDAVSSIVFSSPQADMSTTEFYVVDQIPTTSADETEAQGDGGFVNLPVGVVEITASNKKTGLVLDTVTILIRAGAVTTAYIGPVSRGTASFKE